MRRLVGTLTERGQVTVPAEVRRHLDVGPKDRLVFTIEDDGGVRVQRAEFTLKTAFGSVEPTKRPEDLERVIRDAKDERAERVASDEKQ